MQLERLVLLFKNNNFGLDLNQDQDTGYFSLLVSDPSMSLPHLEIRSPNYESLIEVRWALEDYGLFLDPNMPLIYHHILRMMNTLLNERMYSLLSANAVDELNKWAPFHSKIQKLMQIQSMNVAYDAVIYKHNIEEDIWIQDLMGRNIIQARKGELFMFIDQNPSANWAHECIYALIDLATNKLRFKEADMPPTSKINIDWNQKH